MIPIPAYLTAQSGDILLALKVQPRASRNAILGALGHELRVALTAPPVDEAANEALVRFLAEQLHCARRQIELIRGRTSRHKIVCVKDVPVETILQHLSPAPRTQ